MTKIKTYKTKRKETIHILSSLMSNLKSARMHKWRRVVPSRKQFILESASSYCNVHILSYTIYYTFHFVLPHCTFHISLSFLLMALESRCCPIKPFILVSKKFDHRSVKRTSCNSWKWRAIHLEQHTKHCISKLLLFSFKFSLKQVFWKRR